MIFCGLGFLSCSVTFLSVPGWGPEQAAGGGGGGATTPRRRGGVREGGRTFGGDREPQGRFRIRRSTTQVRVVLLLLLLCLLEAVVLNVLPRLLLLLLLLFVVVSIVKVAPLLLLRSDGCCSCSCCLHTTFAFMLMLLPPRCPNLDTHLHVHCSVAPPSLPGRELQEDEASLDRSSSEAREELLRAVEDAAREFKDFQGRQVCTLSVAKEGQHAHCATLPCRHRHRFRSWR